MPIVGYARVSTTGQDLAVQLVKLQAARCDKIFKEKRSGVDAGRPDLKRCLEYLREGDTLLVTKIDRLARSTSDLYRIVSLLAEKGVAFKVTDDPSIDTTSRTGKLVMGILALIAEFENDIRRERQMDGIAKAKERASDASARTCLAACCTAASIIRFVRPLPRNSRRMKKQANDHTSSGSPLMLVGPPKLR